MRAPSFHHEQAPQSPRSGPPPEYAPPRWYDHQFPREPIWQPPTTGHRDRITHRLREAEAAYHFPLRRRQMHHIAERSARQEPWTVPTPKIQDRKNEAVKIAEKGIPSNGDSDESKKKEGNSLSLLAKVSSSMAPPRKRKSLTQQQRNEESKGEDPETTGERKISPSAATPQAPRTSGADSPIQPGSGFHGGPVVTPYGTIKVRPASINATPKPITPTGHPANHRPLYSAQQRPPQHYGATTYTDERGPRYYGPSSQSRGIYSDGPSTTIHHFYHPGTQCPTPQSPNHLCGETWNSPNSEHAFYSPHPAVVERNSFDSAENNLGCGPHLEPGAFWHSPNPLLSPYHGRYEGAGPYLSPRWSYEGHAPLASFPHPPGPPQPFIEERLEGDRFPAPTSFAPYTYVQQPNSESKTLLRKKFSWKHYPEVRIRRPAYILSRFNFTGISRIILFLLQLERFLVENREEYLEHSSRNYTVAQKQYNNMLTERLLEVAEKAGYAFDQDEFNFVSIRDRIRCYYKSYVQTVRKRGLPLPGNLGSSKNVKTCRGGEEGNQEEEEEANEEQNSNYDAEA